jgi:hypothetical protein
MPATLECQWLATLYVYYGGKPHWRANEPLHVGEGEPPSNPLAVEYVAEWYAEILSFSRLLIEVEAAIDA